MTQDHRGEVRLLAGDWRTAAADDETRRRALQRDGDVDLPGDGIWHDVTVPSHWRDEPGFESHDGTVMYRHAFDEAAGPHGARSWLVVDGALAQSEVWLDGSYLGPTDGYFSPVSFEVTETMRVDEHHDLVIEVACPPAGDRSAKRLLTGCLQDSDLIDRDWNPGGLWRVPRLERTGPVRMDRLRVVCQQAQADRAVLVFDAVLLAAEPTQVDVTSLIDPAADRLGLGAAATTTTSFELAAGSNNVQWRLAVEAPSLWWPRALGPQPLYDVRAEVRVDGELSHVRKRRTGLRQIELDDWIMSVNGERLFLKGAMLHPSTRSLGAITIEDVHADLALAVDAGLDLVRLNTHVARPALYRRADELGLLIWQDLPMVRGMHRSVRGDAARQATDLVDLLGHHPSIALWCAHDDPTGRTADADAVVDPASHRRWKRRRLAAQELPSWNRTVLDRSVARAFRSADPSRPAVPHSGVLPHPPLLEGSDSQAWLGWERGSERDLPVLAARLPRLVRFVAGIGAQSVPDSAAFCEPERWPELDWQRLSDRHGLRKAQLERRVAVEDHPTFESWRIATQRSHADLVRRHVEQLRRLKYRPTGGFVVDTLIDPQDSISTALVDHHRRPKLAYGALIEACRPLIVVAEMLPEEVHPGERLELEVHVVSDLRRAVNGAIVSAVLDVGGRLTTWRWEGDIEGDSVARVGHIVHLLEGDPCDIRLVVTLDADGLRSSQSEWARLTPVP